MDASVPELQLAALAPLPPGRLEALAARLSRRVPAACRTVELSGLVLPRLADREQLDADRLLEQLEARVADRGGVLVGVALQDLALPIFTFVFGRARMGGRAALVSLARLDPLFYGLPRDPALLERRAVDEVLHELGHVASLPHCPAADCLMRFAGTVEKADARGSLFCAACRSRLPPWLRPAG
jgi:archaemetzincin